jgi:uncharacterized protein (TIGR02466 family)
MLTIMFRLAAESVRREAAMPAELARQAFWTTTFYATCWAEHEQHAPEIIDFLYRLRDRQTTPIASGVAPGAKSSYGLYESDFDLFDRDHHGLRQLRQFATMCVQHAVSHVNQSRIPPRQLQVEFRDSWFHITNSGGFHDAHVHGGCSWCGIYYLQVGDSGQRGEGGAPNGGNRFYSPLWRGGAYQDFGNNYLSMAYVDPPIRDGMLLLFPSYLLHSGLPYRGEKDRIVISFNTRTLAPGSESREVAGSR